MSITLNNKGGKMDFVKFAAEPRRLPLLSQKLMEIASFATET